MAKSIFGQNRRFSKNFKIFQKSKFLPQGEGQASPRGPSPAQLSPEHAPPSLRRPAKRLLMMMELFRTFATSHILRTLDLENFRKIAIGVHGWLEFFSQSSAALSPFGLKIYSGSLKGHI